MRILDSLKYHRNHNIIIFWGIVTATNAVLGISIASVAIVRDAPNVHDVPAFVQLARQAHLAQTELKVYVDKNTKDVHELTRRADIMEQRVIMLEKRP